MIKLLALDLDGTLLNSHGYIPEENARAIRAAEERGVLVTFATGRRFRDARPVAREIGFNAPIVTHNGALIKNADTLETVHVSLLNEPTSREILRVGREFGGDALVSTDPRGEGALLYDRISDENIPLQRYIKWTDRVHRDSEEGGSAVHHVESLDNVIGTTEIVHISFSGHCGPMYDMQRLLEDELGDSVNILATIYPEIDFTLLDVLPPGASKASGLHWLATSHGFSHENVMAIGDNFNDLEMLDYAGTSVVMGNGQPELLAREDFHKTDSNDEAGVAAAIQRFILGDE